ncbi:MAG: hypothetical protein V2J12_01825, partial [Gammaproteobacteria bacterium]|nr:hypothetical protein [Gammaproteobacteria bacterium]
MDVQLRQRGRARIEFLSDLAAWSGRLGYGIDQELERRGLTAETLAAERPERLRQVEQAMAECLDAEEIICCQDEAKWTEE